jgi:hypothetical protein
MFIYFNSEKIEDFTNVIFAQDFSQYRGMTSKYRAFEDPNLPDDIKMSVLKKLSVTNHLELPNFENFWVWIKRKHGTALSIMLAKFIAPNDGKMAAYLKNAMSHKTDHDLWLHIKARVYKKWCSIVTEMQCVYAVVEGVKKLNLNWEVIASPELDAIGIDFAIVINTENKKVFYPIQIKKDSFSVYAQQKHNAKENFDIVELKKKAIGIIEAEMKKLNII